MEYALTKFYGDVKSRDNQGDWIFRVHRDGKQVTIFSGDGDVFIDTDLRELTAIYELIGVVIDDLKQKP